MIGYLLPGERSWDVDVRGQRLLGVRKGGKKRECYSKTVSFKADRSVGRAPD